MGPTNLNVDDAGFTEFAGNKLKENQYTQIIGTEEKMVDQPTFKLTITRRGRMVGSAANARVIINGETVLKVRNTRTETIELPVKPTVIEMDYKLWQKWNRVLLYPSQEEEYLVVDLNPAALMKPKDVKALGWKNCLHRVLEHRSSYPEPDELK